MSSNNFYKAFEDAHRGSRELIKKRVSVYLPFVTKLKEMYPNATVLDIGCGRGEWLELLRENDVIAKGVDLDEGMLHECSRRSLHVECADGIELLKKQQDESLMLVSAFHVVEHISFEDLQTFIKEAKRVLKPAGLLILETPNPENIKVATENFYLDPTHTKPIPANLLAFSAKFYKYERVKILRLQEASQLAKKENITLSDVLEGVSPDYAVIAQKFAKPELLERFHALFTQEYGLPLSVLSAKFEHRLEKIEAKATQAEAKATQAEAKATQAEAKATQAEQNYYAILNSKSWKITKPLREVTSFIRWFLTGVRHWVTFSPTSRPRRVVKKVLLSLKYKIASQPKLKKISVYILTKYPKLNMLILRLIMPQTKQTKTDLQENRQLNSPRAKQIYKQLQESIKKNEGIN
ncbi:class I SAM-dependent methyltransferase [Sulfurimonas sp. NW9]|uniref:class I SAM-dependent methyltransferase n=1 Tax=Sulfurimonas sp. NW9 TaxID=2922728 RepID=UPI003DA8F297